MTRRIIVALLMLGAGAATWLYASLYLAAGPSDPVAPVGVVAPPRMPEARVVTAFPGAGVRQIFVTKGDRVREGQLLVQLELEDVSEAADRTSAAHNRISPAAMEAAGSLLQRILPQTWAQLLATDPQLLTAEQEYADALLADEREPSQANRLRLRRAKARRVRAQDRLSQLGPHSVQAFGDLHRMSEEAEKWMARERTAREVRAPVDGSVEIFDLSPGDKLPPSGRVALIAASLLKKDVR